MIQQPLQRAQARHAARRRTPAPTPPSVDHDAPFTARELAEAEARFRGEELDPDAPEWVEMDTFEPRLGRAKHDATSRRRSMPNVLDDDAYDLAGDLDSMGELPNGLDWDPVGGALFATAAPAAFASALRNFASNDSLNGMIDMSRGATDVALGGVELVYSLGQFQQLAGSLYGLDTVADAIDLIRGGQRLHNGELTQGTLDLTQAALSTASNLVPVLASGPAAPAVGIALYSTVLAMRLGRRGERVLVERSGLNAREALGTVHTATRAALRRRGFARDDVATRIAARSAQVAAAMPLGVALVALGAGRTVTDVASHGERFGHHYLGGLTAAATWRAFGRAGACLGRKTKPNGRHSERVGKAAGKALGAVPAAAVGAVTTALGIGETAVKSTAAVARLLEQQRAKARREAQAQQPRTRLPAIEHRPRPRRPGPRSQRVHPARFLR